MAKPEVGLLITSLLLQKRLSKAEMELTKL